MGGKRILSSHLAPDKRGYIQWHEWAEKQTKKGIKQTQCPQCHLWFFPEEL